MASRHVRGSKVRVDSTGIGNQLQDIGCIFAISMPMLTRGVADVTCMSDTTFYRQFIKGFKDSGEATFKFRFEPASYAAMKVLYEDDVCDNMPFWEIAFGICEGDDTPLFTFNGIITELSMPEKSIDGENTWEADVKIKISGASAFDDGGGVPV